MDLTCEKCGRIVSPSAGKYVYYQNRMTLACKACAKNLKNEMKAAKQICAVVDGKKEQAVHVTTDHVAFVKFLISTDAIMEKISDVGNARSDIPLLVDLAKSYVTGKYLEIPYNSVVTAVATLLYVIDPIDIIPDAVPNVGFSDDATAVALCVRTLDADLKKFRTWRGQNNT